MLENQLGLLGLSQKEAIVYLALLKNGPTTTLKLAAGTAIKRPTVYLTLDSLKKRGLVEIQSRGLKSNFAAVDPRQFGTLLSEKEKQFEEILPELLGFYKLRGSKNIIKYYEGTGGVKTAYEDILREMKAGDPYYAIADQHNWEKFDNDWFENYLERKARRMLDTRIILKDSKIARRYHTMARIWKLKVKITDHALDVVGDIVVCPQRLLLHNFAPPITAAVIEHPDIIQTHLNLFRFIWNMLPDTKDDA